jgi:hypothetical protein
MLDRNSRLTPTSTGSGIRMAHDGNRQPRFLPVARFIWVHNARQRAGGYVLASARRRNSVTVPPSPRSVQKACQSANQILST